MTSLHYKYICVCKVQYFQNYCSTTGAHLSPRYMIIHVPLLLLTSGDQFYGEEEEDVCTLFFSLFHRFLFSFTSFYFPIVLFTFLVAWLERLNAFFFLFLLQKC